MYAVDGIEERWRRRNGAWWSGTGTGLLEGFRSGRDVLRGTGVGFTKVELLGGSGNVRDLCM